MNKSLKQDYSWLIDEHRKWLNQFCKEASSKWEKLLKNDVEAALCEAGTRKLLADNEVQVKPNDHLSNGGPDFLCNKNDGTFYVEVTCITKDAATKATGLSDPLQGPCLYAFLTERIRSEVSNKTQQCSNLDAPCIIVIGTFHFEAGIHCFSKYAAGQVLTATPKLTGRFDSQSCQVVGQLYQSTDLVDSAFIREKKDSPGQMEYARNPISAILLCLFDFGEWSPIGILHPNPNHKFDRGLLADIEFCRLADGYQTGELSVEWI